MSTTPPQNFLRQRNTGASPQARTPMLPDEFAPPAEQHADKRPEHEEVIWGKTPGGEGEPRDDNVVLYVLTLFIYSLPRPNDT